MSKSFHSVSYDKALRILNSSSKGLSDKEAKDRLSKNGYNEISDKKKFNYLLIILRQFKSFFVLLLVVAAMLSYFIGHFLDMYVIIGIIIINASIGFFLERKAEQSINALKRIIVPHAKVLRDGEMVLIKARELVVGDIVILEEGDRIPADCRLISIKNLQTVESSLTGESFPVDKSVNDLPEKTVLADRKNMVFMGTFVSRGRAKAVVVSIGKSTALGEVAESIKEIKKEKSHFQTKVDKLAFQMGVLAIIGAGIVFSIGYFIREISLVEIFSFTLASLISGVPEGLPAILAIVLSVGAVRMAKKNAIIRSLPATETLGVIDTIITDKTGTLTENTMTIKKVLLPYQDDVEVSGSGWEVEGEFSQKGKKIDFNKNLSFLKVINISGVCTSAKIINEDGKYSVIGDPTEAALSVLAEKGGFSKKERIKKIDDLPFNPELKYRASLSALTQGKSGREIFVIGAPEAVISRSTRILKSGKTMALLNKDRKSILSKIENVSSNSMRVIALAYKPVSSSKNSLKESDSDDLIYVGCVAMIDPPRRGVKESIEKAKNSGIRIIMATGDHKATAVSIAKEIGIINKNSNANVFTEQELDELSEREFKKVVATVNVFARLTPGMKLKIAEELQSQGKKVAMTGDGVNDAPALKRANIGVSMGIIGTDVARESSEIILADDHFSSIIDAIEEGRIVFNNTRKSSLFLVTTNVAEHASIIATLSLGMPLPLLPTQILWLNLVTDTGPALGLAVEPGEKDILEKKPRNWKENILSKDVFPLFLLTGFLMVIAIVFTFSYYLDKGVDIARTAAFLVVGLTQLFNSFTMRSLDKSVFEIGFFKNKYYIFLMVISFALLFAILFIPFFQRVFNLVPLGLNDLIVLTLISSIVFIAGEGYKIVKRKMK